MAEMLASREVVEAVVQAKSKGKKSVFVPKSDDISPNMIADEFDKPGRYSLDARFVDQLRPHVFVEAGKYLRGTSSNEEAILLRLGSAVLPIEKPQRSIYLEAFHIDKYPITNEEYSRFVESTGYRAEGISDCGTWLSYYSHGKELHPVVCVSWKDIQSYCRWAEKRLPTEAEWEKAARGTDGRIFPWGNQFDESRCNSTNYQFGTGRGFGSTTPVDAFPDGVSPYGCYDMVGNVWELVSDWLDISTNNGGNYYAISPPRNPKGPSSGQIRVMRGGAFSTHTSNCRCAFRIGPDSSTQFDRVGFRCVVDG